MRFLSKRYILQQKCVNGQNKYELGVVVLEAMVVVPVDGVVGAALGVVDEVDFGVEV